MDQFLRGTRNFTFIQEDNFISIKRRVQWKNIKTVKTDTNISSFKVAITRYQKKLHHPVTTTVYNRKHKMSWINTKGERWDSKIGAVPHNAWRKYSYGNPKKRKITLKTSFLSSESRSMTTGKLWRDQFTKWKEENREKVKAFLTRRNHVNAA